MKHLMTILLAILAFSASATEKFEIISLWKSADAESSKRYMAIVRQSEDYEDLDFAVIFGNKNGEIKKRVFGFHGSRFYTYEGASDRSHDDFYNFESKSIERDKKVQVTLTPRINNWKTHNITYLAYDSTASKRFANTVIKKVLAEKEKVMANKKPTSLSAFKKYLQTLKTFSAYWDHAYDYDEPRETFNFPLYDLQIEYGLGLTMPNKSLAKAKINSKGTDLITKKYRESKKWYQSTDEVEEEIAEILEHNRNGGWDSDDYKEVGSYSLYRKGSSVKGFTKKWLKDAAKKFVKYEIETMTGYDCEGGDYLQSDFTWILNDGTVFSYSPYTECD